MAPPRKIVRRQLEIMIDFLEENKEMSKGIPPSSPISHQTIKENWIKLAKTLNSIEGGAKKAPDGWKKYWFEWRHRCRKKAANARRFQTKNTSGSHRFVPLNDLEVRVLDLNGKGSVSATISSSNKLENFLADDSESEHAMDSSEPIFQDISQSIKRKSITDTLSRSGTPPPKWALELEDRRIAAEERMANALESIANSMRLQEERQSIIEDRIADALTAIAGTLQDLNGSQKNVLQHSMKHSQSDHNETSSMKDVIFL
ncbi:unnamed protein product [Danaus chrysippus]|uniref:(African queen) hypothetical protein n=1 Tax=Danaus chrysippus TaxID=151541 RepID=A0A8J2QWG0_9NEOP|nr:unnamed protein product [Danaus chrysippus]